MRGPSPDRSAGDRDHRGNGWSRRTGAPALTAAVALAIAVGAPAAHAASADDAAAAATAVSQAAQVPSGWTGSTASCDPGTESQASLDATLLAVNRFRAVANLAPVTFDASQNSKALAAAMMMRAGNENGYGYGLSHQPSVDHPDWPCSGTPDAVSGAGSSNLALGASGANAIRLYVDDDGVSSLGHRRWVLDPAATVFGSGSTGMTNALAVFGTPGSAATVPTGSQVAWPPAGAIAPSWVPATWSVSVGGTGDAVALAAPQVQMTLDGAAVSVGGVSDLGTGYGTGRTLAWVPSLDRSALRTGYHQLAVNVSGFAVNGTPAAVSYTTTIGTAPASTPPPATGASAGPTPTPLPSLPALRPKVTHPRGKVRPGVRLSATFTPGTGRIVTRFQWLRSGKPIKGATAVRYKVSKSDRGHSVRVQVSSQAKDGTSKGTELSASVKVPRR